MDSHASNIRAANRRRQGVIDQLTSEAYCSWRDIAISITTRSLVFSAVFCPPLHRVSVRGV